MGWGFFLFRIASQKKRNDHPRLCLPDFPLHVALMYGHTSARVPEGRVLGHMLAGMGCMLPAYMCWPQHQAARYLQHLHAKESGVHEENIRRLQNA